MRYCLFLLSLACDSTVKTVVVDESDGIIITDVDGDGYSEEDGDCDDENGSIHPGEEEICDGLDNNCSGDIDEGVKTVYYADGDGDGFGNNAYTEEACSAPAGYVPNGNDCDDENASVYPSASEICDGFDNNCNDLVDDGLGLEVYIDADFDGFGDPDQVVEGCQEEAGFAPVAGDCDDNNPAINPNAAETCDEIDNNCDTRVDEGVQNSYYIDADGDGFGDINTQIEACIRPAGYSENSTDCEDGNPSINPSASELCDGGIDNNCDGLIDDSSSVNRNTYYTDADNDGFGDINFPVQACILGFGIIDNAEDCDDSNPFIKPDALEICDNGIDNDCDGAADDEDPSVDSAPEWFLDADTDGFGNQNIALTACLQPTNYVSDATDCNDLDFDVNTDAIEICDTIDNNCSGDIDDADPMIQYDSTDVFYFDFDNDGYGYSGSMIEACIQPSGYVKNSDDCDDANGNVNPETIWYADSDLDGFGTVNFTTSSCTKPSGYVADGTDCDDISNLIYPNAPEYCDEIDQDCDGATYDSEALDPLTWHMDTDGDGFGDPNTPILACLQPADAVENDDDCDDTNSLVFPFSHEIEIPFDGIDQDCDGYDVCKDFNCDAWPDIAFGSYYASGYNTNSYVYYGSEAGYSNLDRDTLANVGVADVDRGDFNGDGYLDLLLTSYYNNSYFSPSTIYYGAANGLDMTNTAEVTVYGTIASCIGDLNGDGYDDIVQASHFDGDYYTNSSIFWGSPTGVDNSNQTVLYTNSPHDCAVEDLNQDGYLDIYFPSYAGYRTAFIYWGSSSGVYDQTNFQEIYYLDYTLTANVDDVNGDGYPDLVFGSFHSNSGIYYGSSTGYSASSFDSYYQYGSYDSAAADLDNDGLIDIVSCPYQTATGSYSSTEPTIFWNTGAGYSNNYRTILEGNSCRDVEIVDVNQDGYLDIFFMNTLSGNTTTYYRNTNSYLYYGSSSGYSINNRSVIPSYNSLGIDIADLNFDGYPDLVLGNYMNNAILAQNDSVIYWGGQYGWGGNSTNLSAVGVRGVEIVGSWIE